MSAVKTLIGVPQDGNYLNMGFKTQDEQVSIHFFYLVTLLFVFF